MTREIQGLSAWQLSFVIYNLWHAWTLARSNWQVWRGTLFFWVLPSLHVSTASCLQPIAKCLTPLKRKILIVGRSLNAQAINWSFPPGVHTVRSRGNTSDLAIPSSMCPNSLLLCYKCLIVGSEVRGCEGERHSGQKSRVKRANSARKDSRYILGLSWDSYARQWSGTKSNILLVV